MDFFYEAVSESLGMKHKRRMHFNAAMLEVHCRLHRMDKDHALKLLSQEADDNAMHSNSGDEEEEEEEEEKDVDKPSNESKQGIFRLNRTGRVQAAGLGRANSAQWDKWK
eukprot:gene7743-918_t